MQKEWESVVGRDVVEDIEMVNVRGDNEKMEGEEETTKQLRESV